MSSDLVIKAERLGKSFRMFAQPHDRLKQMIVPRLERLIGGKPSQYFREFWAVRDVSFEIRRGETVGILGRNGSGKSTLLHLICGTLSPSDGKVESFGRVAALLELGSGFNAEFTGRENVLLSGQILGRSRQEIAARLDDIVAFADIGDFLDLPVKTYSSGMYVRLAFAVAIHVDPDVLVVDEALAVGDTPFQTKCLARIREMQKAGTAILLVSHSLNTVIEFCDRAIYLRHGQLVVEGKCREVVERYADDIVAEEGGIYIPSTPFNNGTEVVSAPNSVAQEQLPRSEILSVSLKDKSGRERTTYSSGEELFVSLKVRFNEANAKPCFGVQISSVDGIALWSATTNRFGRAIPAQKAGKVSEYTWRLQLNLGVARFVVSIGIGDVASGEYHRHHRLEYAGHFDVLPTDDMGSGWLGIRSSFVHPIDLY